MSCKELVSYHIDPEKCSGLYDLPQEDALSEAVVRRQEDRSILLTKRNAQTVRNLL